MKFFCFFLLPVAAFFAEEPTQPPLEPEEKGITLISEVRNEISLNGQEYLPYKAKIYSFPVRFSEKSIATIYSVSYFTEEEEEPEKRPITFFMNGGPGGSSLLQLAGIGPKRIRTQEEGQTLTPPYQWIENPCTLLTHTDLVFVDTVDTGISRPAEKINPRIFFDSIFDLEVLKDFIFDFLTKENRWESPKYVGGLSYGGFRTAGLSHFLLSHGIFLNGILLLSPAIDFNFTDASFGNLTSFALLLPSYAATAWQHKKFPPEVSFIDAIEGSLSFVYQQLGPALFLNRAIPPSLYGPIASWTGLPFELVVQNEGFIDVDLFLRNLCASEKKWISRYDSRLKGDALIPNLGNRFIDPGAQRSGIYTATYHAYLKKELKWDLEWPRYSDSDCINYWNFNLQDTTYSLQVALIVNPEMRIFLASGYFDLRTPFTASGYALKNLRLPKKDTLTLKVYEGGHDFLSSPKVLEQFSTDLKVFYKQQS